MSAVLEAIVGCFIAQPTYERASETFSAASFECTGTKANLQPLDRIAEYLRQIGQQDWVLMVQPDLSDAPFSFNREDEGRWAGAYSELAAAYDDSQHLRIVLNVSQRVQNGEIRILDPDCLFTWLSAQEVPALIAQFSELLGSNSRIIFVHEEFSQPFGSGTFTFAPLAHSLLNVGSHSLGDRESLALARRECVTTDWNSSVFPEDFRAVSSDNEGPAGRVFARIENFLAVSSLADAVVKAGGNSFIVRVKGHRMQEQVIHWSDIPDSRNVVLQQVYDWVYHLRSAGPLTDRLGLARNFISLHWKDGIFRLDPRVVPAIKAGYELYLKKNLKDFVEIRSKVTGFILEIEGKAAKSVENAVSNLEKNFYGIATFITSVLLIKVLQDKSFSGAFNPNTARLAYALIGISFLHAAYAATSVLSEMNRSEVLYTDLRRQYSVFFAPADFDNIFGRSTVELGRVEPSRSSSPLASTRSYVCRRLSWLMAVWIGSLVIAFGLVLSLTERPAWKNPSPANSVNARGDSPSVISPRLQGAQEVNEKVNAPGVDAVRPQSSPAVQE